MIVELKPTLWIAANNSDGFPMVTFVKENAFDFKSEKDAIKALMLLRTKEPYPDAVISDDFI